jgi:hypothetical protein
VPSWSDRPLDRTLISLSLVAATLLGLLEVLSGPQLATRLALSLCYKTAVTFGLPWIYELPSSWRGWYSLEIGVEITTAIVLGFLVWLLFALVYDAAGILVGLVPSSVTSIVTLTFRFHLHSYALLAVVPIVVRLACSTLTRESPLSTPLDSSAGSIPPPPPPTGGARVWRAQGP